MNPLKSPAHTGESQVVTNMRGDRAFDIRANKILCHEPSFAQRIVMLALAAGMFGAFATPAEAAPAKPAARHGYHFQHRSVWAAKWAAAHPAQEAAYQRKIMGKYVRRPYAAHRWTPRGRTAVHAWGAPAPIAGKTAHAWAPAPSHRWPRTTWAKSHGRHGHRWGHRWSTAIAPAAVDVPESAQSYGANAGGIGMIPSIPATHVNILPSIEPVMKPIVPVQVTAAPIAAMPAKKPAPIKVAKADTQLAYNSDTDDAPTSPNVSLDFVAADINDVLKSLAMQTHTNVVSGADVKGTITVTLTHVSLDEALDMITKLSGYSYAKVGRTYVVGTPASIQTLTTSGTASLAPTTAVLTLTYSDWTQMVTSIKDRYPNVKVTPGTAVGSVGAGGVLLVTGTADDISGVKSLVQTSEDALARGVASSKTVYYKIKYSSAIDLASVLSRLVPGVMVTPAPTSGFSLKAPITADSGSGSSSTTVGPATSSGGGGTSTQTASNGSSTSSTTTSTVDIKANVSALLLTGSDTDTKRALDILGQVDVRPAQITYEAKITEINMNSDKTLGVNWDFSGFKTTIGETLPKGVKPDDPTLPVPFLGNISRFGRIGRTPISNMVSVSLDALFKSGDAKLLSNPNISAVDGEPAAVFIGDTVNYVSSISSSNGQQTVTTSSLNIGIKLFVTGKVNNDGEITLNIHPEVSTITGFLDVPGGGQLPQVANREATTTVRCHDGETIAIGGLISEDDIKSVSKVPVLGDLPFFGQLFRDNSHTHRRNEVVIFVKVSVQKDEQTAENK